MSSSPDRALTGHCYCGEVAYEVEIPAGESPHFSGYCHCDSCRRAHAAPLYQVVIMRGDWFRITRGAELVRDFERPGVGINRSFCSACGTRVVNRFPNWRPRGKEMVAFFPNTLDEDLTHPFPEDVRPQGHNRSDECVLDAVILEPLLR